ncbi:MAG: hypothetical protein HZA54_19540 [Planctomycetes bacterium]|nr:hypothetical protein [Planctomycetota bacterium]
MSTHVSQDTRGGTGAPADAAAAAAAAATGPEAEEPGVAERLRAGARYFTVGILLLAGAGGAAWLAWDRDSRRELDAALAAVRAAGLDDPSDDDPQAHLPPEQNAATLYLEACARLPDRDSSTWLRLRLLVERGANDLDGAELRELRRLLESAPLAEDLLAAARTRERCEFTFHADCFPDWRCRAERLDKLQILLAAHGAIAAREGHHTLALVRFREAARLLRALGTRPCPTSRALWSAAALLLARLLQYQAPAAWEESEWQSLLDLLPPEDALVRWVDRALRVRVSDLVRRLEGGESPLLPSDTSAGDLLRTGPLGILREALGRPRARLVAAFALRSWQAEAADGWLLALPRADARSLEGDRRALFQRWRSLLGPASEGLQIRPGDLEAYSRLALVRAGVMCEIQRCQTWSYPQAVPSVNLPYDWDLELDLGRSLLRLRNPRGDRHAWALRYPP